MQYATLGRPGPEVSQVGCGYGNVGGLLIRGTPGEQVRAASRAMELDVSYFNIARSYGDRISESRLGRVLKELKARVYVGTRVGLASGKIRDVSARATKSVDRSLSRLGLEWVDLTHFHNRVGGHRLRLSKEYTNGELPAQVETKRGLPRYRLTGLSQRYVGTFLLNGN